jgi:hypothetical protein
MVLALSRQSPSFASGAMKSPHSIWAYAPSVTPKSLSDPALAAPSNQGKMMTTQTVTSTSDKRTVDNVMRHAYRVLSDEEKATMQKIKDDGLAFHDFLSSLGSSRELALAKTKIEEAVMWAVKHITA